MAAGISTVAMPIKDLKPGMNNLNLTFIVIEIGRPTITKENQVRLTNVLHGESPGLVLVGGQNSKGG